MTPYLKLEQLILGGKYGPFTFSYYKLEELKPKQPRNRGIDS